ncbi:DedA family protein [Thiomicrorhabdus sp. zzn3]|uniref:YqaA family protein n=1 Tax=Thiomicrorhabdus sp. zzn3 TaxID=3039775 RepID=UPI002436E9B2|nr:DedA family protein [Thiomicrorhabdus sp. zzn3]MDG6778523.1 DedA family protein [Thiomicrorhabdus sp. zzn3]
METYLDAYLSLFLLSFLAATLIPAGSEVLLSSLLLEGYDPFSLWLWATLGNTLGAVVNYLLGRYLLHFQSRRWFPFKADSLHKSQAWFGRYGVWSLLFSWAPLLGDALTFIAGVMRVRFWLFLLLTALGKGARYAILVGLVDLLAA